MTLGEVESSYDLFLSYSRADAAAAEQVRKMLESAGIRTFLDSHDLSAGLPWPQALERALLSVRSVAILIGPAGFGGWQRREMYFALDRQANEEREGRNFPVIPILLEGADIQPCFLFLNTWVDLRAASKSHDLVPVIARSLEGSVPKRAVSVVQRTRVCPYLGLRAFTEENAAFFFARTDFVRRLSHKVLLEGQRVVSVVGPSGCGKSSVVMAGLIPHLRKQRPPRETWDAIILTPGRYPWRSLADALVRLREPNLANEDYSAKAAKLEESLKSGNGAIDSEIRRAIEDSKGTDRLLVVIDQLEELFTQTPKSERLRFIEPLLELSELRSVTIVLILRDDYYHQAASLDPKLSESLDGNRLLKLGPMAVSEIRDVITGPANLVGLSLEPGLLDHVLKDFNKQPGSLPLLEHALTSMWTQSADVLTLVGYEEAGGIMDSIGRSAELVYSALPSEQARESCRHLVTRLVDVSLPEPERWTRRLVRRSSLSSDEWEIAEQFASPNRRLLVISADSGSGEQSVEVAHEQLIVSWSRMLTWLKDDRNFILWQQMELDTLLDGWRRLGKGTNGLLRGKRLRDARASLRKRRAAFSGEEIAFVTRSANRERTRRAGAAMGIMALLLGLGWILYQQTDRAQVVAIIDDFHFASAQIPDADARASALRVLALSLAKAGRLEPSGRAFDEAQRSVGEIPDEDRRTSIFMELADSLAQVGRIEQSVQALTEAQNRAGRIPDLDVRATKLTAVAEAMAKAGMSEQSGRAFGDAQRYAAQVPDMDARAARLMGVAEALAETGRAENSARAYEDARRSIRQIVNAASRAGMQSSLAESLARVGSLADAELEVNQISRAYAYARASALVVLGGELGKAGKLQDSGRLFHQAQEAALQISSTASQRSALIALIESLCKAQRFDDARFAAAQIRYPASKAGALFILAESLSKAGDFGGAHRAAMEIADLSISVSALTDLSGYLAKAGMPEQSTKVLNEAQSLVGQISDPDARSIRLIEMAESLAAARQTEASRKDFDEALRLAAQYPEVDTRANRLLAIAKALARVRNAAQSRTAFASAELAALQIVDGNVRSKTLRALAEFLAESGDLRQARYMAQRCEPVDVLLSYGSILDALTKPTYR